MEAYLFHNSFTDPLISIPAKKKTFFTTDDQSSTEEEKESDGAIFCRS